MLEIIKMHNDMLRAPAMPVLSFVKEGVQLSFQIFFKLTRSEMQSLTINLF
jgi:hypothetical protein